MAVAVVLEIVEYSFSAKYFNVFCRAFSRGKVLTIFTITSS